MMSASTPIAARAATASTSSGSSSWRIRVLEVTKARRRFAADRGQAGGGGIAHPVIVTERGGETTQTRTGSVSCRVGTAGARVRPAAHAAGSPAPEKPAERFLIFFLAFTGEEDHNAK